MYALEENMSTFKETSMVAIFQNQVAKYGDKPCIAYKKDNIYIDISWNEMNHMVMNLAYHLLAIGIKKGDKIAIFSENRYEWWIADLAILSIGAVDIPIYATNSAEEALYILDNSESKICIVATADHLEKVQKVKRKLPKLKEIIIFDEIEKKKKNVIDLPSALKKGEEYKQKANFAKRIKAIKPDDLATIIYTSGTTGDPKGVMLSHKNFLSNVKNTLSRVEGYLTERDSFLSFLPLSHVLERTAGFYVPIFSGAKVSFAESLVTLMEDFQLTRPTVIISVPRIYEKVHTGINTKVADASPIKKMMFNWSMGVARKNIKYVCRETRPGGLLGLKLKMAEKLVFSKLRFALGMDKIKFAISGGGPLSISDGEFFIGMGLPILEGYGLTETSPITHYNLPSYIKPGTVGPAIEDTQVRISDEGEILIKGPQVMQGYYKDKKSTNESFTKDGFFKTGDIGIIDDDGYLSITGRIKDIIVTAGGKNISPQNIENSLKMSHYIAQVAVIGDNRKYLSALIIPAYEDTHKWAKRNSISVSNNSELIKHPDVVELFQNEIERFTKKFARVEQIRRFTLLDEEWTQGTGELTPTQKVKRRVIDDKYKKVIDKMYPDE